MSLGEHSSQPLLRTRVCDLLGIRHPVVMGGMAGGFTSSALVAAVSNAGGLGTFGASWLTPEEVRSETARIRELGGGSFGLNLLLFANEHLVDAALDCRPPVMAFAWAAPDQDLAGIFARAQRSGCKVMYQAPSVPEAIRGASAGADVIVAQGSEGGGHIGVMGTMALVPMVVRAVQPTPVLAAGGIADGHGLAAALALGAHGVLLGTRFLATVESPLHPNFKQAVVESDGHDTEVTTIPDLISGRIWPGALGRVKRNALIRAWAGREWEVRERRTTLAKEIRAAREAGDPAGAVLWCGQDAGLIDAIEPAGDVVVRIVREAHDILSRRLPDLIASV